ncbi:MAG: type II 3-dehydroquinate dehydratase [Chitinophagales bacterium]
MKKIIIINGPNLNLLGKREPNIYGSKSFSSFFNELKEKFQSQFDLSFFQSNIEGEIINKLQAVDTKLDAVILNAGAYTHTSIAIRDTISASKIKVIEVHISNIFAREAFRKNTLLAEVCQGSISGFGLKSYELALYSFI